VLHGWIRFLLKAALAGAVLWAARRALMRWIDGPAQEPSRDPWPPLTEAEPPLTEAEPAVEAPLEPAGPPAAAPPVEDPPGVAPAAAGSGWVAPDEGGTCPVGHPVKAKLSSKIYHLPGMSAYARTNPDRCYASPERAEADGFTRAKR
jgi:hypothetical protein